MRLAPKQTLIYPKHHINSRLTDEQVDKISPTSLMIPKFDFRKLNAVVVYPYTSLSRLISHTYLCGLFNAQLKRMTMLSFWGERGYGTETGFSISKLTCLGWVGVSIAGKLMK